MSLPVTGEADIVALFSLLSATVFFTLYWFVYASDKLKSSWPRYFRKQNADDFVIFTKYLGFVLLGVVPFLIFWFRDADIQLTIQTMGLGIASGKAWAALFWILGTGIPVVILSYFSAGNAGFQAKYPELREPVWTKSKMIRYAMAWFFYLLGYEFLFRGFLFLALIPGLGFWPALALNMALYVFTHIPKGPDEAAGAGIIGIVLCLSTWQTGSVWPAFIIHTVMAWSGNYFAFRRNPQFQFQ